MILLCPFLLLIPECIQSVITFLPICLRLTNLYLLVISPQSLIKCCACKTANAQTPQIILQPCKYSPRPNPKTHRFYFCHLCFNFQISTHSHPEQNSPLSPMAKPGPPWHFVLQNLLDSLSFLSFRESISSSELQARCAYCEIKCGQTAIPSSWRHRLACVHTDQGSLPLGQVMPTLHDDPSCCETSSSALLLLLLLLLLTTIMTATRSWLFSHSLCEITGRLCRGLPREALTGQSCCWPGAWWAGTWGVRGGTGQQLR